MPTPRYLKPTPFGSSMFGTLAEAITRTSPDICIHLISDRTNEIANLEDAINPRYHALVSWPLDKYLSPFMLEQETRGQWSGYYDPENHTIYSVSELKKEDRDGMLDVAVNITDIRQFIYAIVRGEAMPVYDIFATPKSFLDIPNPHSQFNRQEVKRQLIDLVRECYSIDGAMRRYTGSLDMLATKIKRTIEYYQRLDHVRKTDPSYDLSTVRPVSYDVPTNSYEVYEVLSIFVATWARAHLVFRYLDSKRKTESMAESSRMENELISRWWNQDNNPYTDEELFGFAMKNLLMRSFIVAGQVTDIRGIGYKEDIHYTIEDLAELTEAMLSIVNDLTSRIGRIPPKRGDYREQATKLCRDIVSATI